MSCKETPGRCGGPTPAAPGPAAGEDVTAPAPAGEVVKSAPAPPADGQEEVDPRCLPDSPIVVDFARVQDAAAKILDGITLTPCKPTHFLHSTEMEIFLKCENHQYTGSFKERGARYALMQLPDDQKKRGAISASLGNHAQGMCRHGGLLGIPVTVVMPVIAPIMKVANCRNLGGNVIIEGEDMREAKQIALRKAREEGLVYVNGYDNPDIIAGQGTCGLEILDQVPDVDAILVPVGGGSLLSGICITVKTLKPNVLVYGVETECCASFAHSMREGKPTLYPIKPTLADGLAVSMSGFNSFATASPLVDKMLEVTEESLSVAILKLIELEKLVVEGAGATGLAAVLSGLVPELKGKKVVLVLSGGNIDSTMLGRCVDRGLASEGRLVRFVVTIGDRPGGLAEFCTMVADVGVTIKHVLQQRAWIKQNVFTSEMTAVCEVQDRDHGQQLKAVLSERYGEIKFVGYDDDE